MGGFIASINPVMTQKFLNLASWYTDRLTPHLNTETVTQANENNACTELKVFWQLFPWLKVYISNKARESMLTPEYLVWKAEYDANHPPLPPDPATPKHVSEF